MNDVSKNSFVPPMKYGNFKSKSSDNIKFKTVYSCTKLLKII